MIYLDVTSACLSPLNTGVKRMQRFLHEQLRSHDDYQPVVWQSVLKAYRAVTVRDLQLLESKVTGSPKGWQLYDSFLPGLWRDLRESLADQKSVMVWPSSLTQGDLILVPDLLWDNRGEFFAQDVPAGVKRIGVFHDAISITHPGQSRIDATACARGVRALSRFDGVVCLSKDARNDLSNCWKDLGCDPAPVIILPWPAPFSGVRPDSVAADGSREILYVARLEKRKNHLLLLDACEKLWGEGLKFRLRLIGCKSYPLWTRKVLKRIQILQQQGRDLLWFPHVSDAVLHESYQSAKFTVFPSRAEGFGLPVLESLWHGRPVICDWQGAVGELASEGGCLMVDVSNAEKLAGSIRSLLDDQDTYDDVHRACHGRKMLGWNDYWNSIKVFSKAL
jgi:glycosyltransferase involved in cell wall biosynthesis